VIAWVCFCAGMCVGIVLRDIVQSRRFRAWFSKGGANG